MTVISVDEDTDMIISEIARKLHVSKDEVIKMLIDGEIKIGGEKMDRELEEKLKRLMQGEKGSIIDKMIEMKMIERLDSNKKSGSMDDLLEIMKVKMMMEAMQSKKQESIDPNTILLMYLMKGDSTKADMTKIIEAVTNSTQTKDSTLTEVLKQLLEEKKRTEREEELMGIIEQQNRMIEDLKNQIDEMRRAVLYQRRETRRNRREEDDIIDAVDRIERVKDTFERLGLTKPQSSEDREMAIKQDVVKAKAQLEQKTLEKTSEIVDKVLDGVDRKMDKILAIVEALMKQPVPQREETLREFERRGTITQEEKEEIYKRMREEAMREEEEKQKSENTINISDLTEEDIDQMTEEEKGVIAEYMWRAGYTSSEIAKKLKMRVDKVYEYKPKF